MKKQQGFTLIELLVVIAIIALLASVVLGSLNKAGEKGKDARRLSDIHQVQNALALYYTDNFGYPSTGGTGVSNCQAGGSKGTSGADGYIPGLAPKYIAVLPTDPNTTTVGCYWYKSDGKDYMFYMYDVVDGPVPTALQRPSAPTEKDYAIYTPGGAGW